MKNRGYYDTRTALKPSQAAAMRRFFPQKIKVDRSIIRNLIVKYKKLDTNIEYINKSKSKDEKKK